MVYSSCHGLLAGHRYEFDAFSFKRSQRLRLSIRRWHGPGSGDVSLPSLRVALGARNRRRDGVPLPRWLKTSEVEQASCSASLRSHATDVHMARSQRLFGG